MASNTDVVKKLYYNMSVQGANLRYLAKFHQNRSNGCLDEFYLAEFIGWLYVHMFRYANRIVPDGQTDTRQQPIPR